jgi:hypothetical protein
MSRGAKIGRRRSAGIVLSRMKPTKDAPLQLELPLSAPRPKPPPALRLIPGEGKGVREGLHSRDAVVRVLVEAGADLLLRRISPARAGEIQRTVDQVLKLFDAVDGTPALLPLLRRELDALERLMTQTREIRGRR